MALERLQKVLAQAGVASRRSAEQWILAGRVRVNGKLVRELGSKADPSRDRIEVDGRVVVRQRPVYLVLNKPKAVMSTLRDPEGRRTVVDLLRPTVRERVKPVGRLDYHTSGVLLMTNDGDFAAKLQHPRHGVVRRYNVKVRGEISDAVLARFRDSIVIDGLATRPADVVRIRTEEGKTWIEIALKEGRNRHVRQLAEHAGVEIMRLVRFEYAGITGEGLRPGEWRHLTVDELKALKQAYGVPHRVVSPPPPEAGARLRRQGPVRGAAARGDKEAASRGLGGESSGAERGPNGRLPLRRQLPASKEEHLWRHQVQVRAGQRGKGEWSHGSDREPSQREGRPPPRVENRRRPNQQSKGEWSRVRDRELTQFEARPASKTRGDRPGKRAKSAEPIFAPEGSRSGKFASREARFKSARTSADPKVERRPKTAPSNRGRRPAR